MSKIADAAKPLSKVFSHDAALGDRAFSELRGRCPDAMALAPDHEPDLNPVIWANGPWTLRVALTQKRS